jgi:CubicO group peptidase (beta-lactamase class C family)
MQWTKQTTARSTAMLLASLMLSMALLGEQATAQKAPATLAQGAPQDVGLDPQRLDRLTLAIKRELADGKLPGMVVVVARKGKIVYSEAFGWQDKANNLPMKPDTIFRIYSMTKPLVSVAAMVLVEEGVVQLTDPVSKFLPAFKDMQVSVAETGADGKVTYKTVATVRPMTVQDLLRHTAGLAYGEITKNEPVKAAYAAAKLAQPGVIDFDNRGMTGAEQVERAAKIPLIHQPGTTWEYSIASDILGRVVEAASGKRLAVFLEERVFKPLGMADTAFWLPSAKIGRLAIPFDKDPATGAVNRLIDVSSEPNNDSGGAGAVSTAGDYLRFAQMLLNGGALGERILSRSTVKLMTSDHLGGFISQPLQPGELLLGTKGYTFGLGFATRQDDGIAALAGSQGEYTWAAYSGCYFWIDPREEIVGVYMAAAPSPIRAYYRRMVKGLVYQALID